MNKVNFPLIAMIAVTLGLGISGCASNKGLSDQQLSQQYPEVARLQRQLEAGRSNELAILSPQRYQNANSAYDEAVKLARDGNTKANQQVKAGLAALARADENAATARDLLEEVLEARQKARDANAEQTSPEAFARAERNLLALTRSIEEGRIDRAKAGRAEAIRAYSNIELTALKTNAVDQAKASLARAKNRDVGDVAPKTMRLAEEEYQLALNTLDADRRDTAKAGVHAQRALWHIQRAMQIADIITHFRTSDFEEEDKVLWYQEQLAEVVAPVEKNVSFNQPNKRVVKDLRTQLSKVLDEKESVQMALEQTRTSGLKTVREKELALQAAQEQSEIEKRRNQAIAAKFDYVQSLFSASEAEVYRQTNNILIRAHGFAFKSGDSEIDSVNFGLLNKIVKAVEQFPDSRLVVSGHTDNRGSDDINLNLSMQRAENVATFLNQVGRIELQRIDATGYGKQRPVVSNDTDAGRAANRRVEVLIVNKDGV
ncbi:OmpA family protein [Exilibacterium tricleocarpae]|uniref:OmpA family protein n=1 Tax=Exilibacterium tricleocarpae TaxID=2591008 RepID=A0A545U6R2_9GAMM|nr:OmpA family protein [Exilibacterium tricleocarpae]TQV85160.1 OmpA family protein [Exilibacterium tricleocarpae]